MRLKPLLLTVAAVFILCLRNVDAGQPLSQSDLIRLLESGVYSDRVAFLVHERGVTFYPTQDDIEALRRAGAGQGLLHAVARAHPSAKRGLLPSVTQQPLRNGPSLSPRNTLAITPAPQPITGSETPGPDLSHGLAKIQGKSVAPSTLMMSNWQQYRPYMPEGMIELFEGKHFWKMPEDLRIDISDTIVEKPPPGYIEATGEYSHNVRVIHRPDGSNDVVNYVGGEPFPNPQEPDKGYKLLADLWFAYIPHLVVGTSRNPLTICSQTRHGYVSCTQFSYVLHQVLYNTDRDMSGETKHESEYWYTEWLSVEEPEELRYMTFLTLYPKNNQRSKELFTFMPALRRWVRGSLISHCSPIVGTDYVQDDFRRIGFNGGIGSFAAQFLRHQKILALSGNYAPMGGAFPANYYMPIGWPKPSWGKWQLRDADVIDVRPIGSARTAYCYAKRIIYEDSQTHYALWEDGYDTGMHLWKTALLAQRFVRSSFYGEVPGALTSTAWDVKNDHMTVASTESANGLDVLVNYDAPPEYRSLNSYSTPAGLLEIMR
jgi:Protein of unknown function (DUF1329)